MDTFYFTIDDIDLSKVQQVKRPIETFPDHYKIRSEIRYDGKPYRLLGKNIRYFIEPKSMRRDQTPENEEKNRKLNEEFDTRFLLINRLNIISDSIRSNFVKMYNGTRNTHILIDIIVVLDAIDRIYDLNGNMTKNHTIWTYEYFNLARPDVVERLLDGTLGFDLKNAPEYILKGVIKGCDSDDKMCPICHVEIKNLGELFITSCHHIYHRTCLIEAYKFNKSCCICKKRM